jgi:hypothetical protein
MTSSFSLNQLWNIHEIISTEINCLLLLPAGGRGSSSEALSSSMIYSLSNSYPSISCSAAISLFACGALLLEDYKLLNLSI